ncbi:MAG: Helix-turn-helix domain protein [Lentisphaerae bacterium ADurb.BinA184]|nr:MAG: Helix-turn-helix domain protein [Lentisphaerae bacterium ADurb.BinA184]
MEAREAETVRQGMRLVRIDEVARILAVSKRTVWRLIDRGELPRAGMVRPARCFLGDVQAYLERLRGDSAGGERGCGA